MVSVEATGLLLFGPGHPITKRKQGLRGWQFEKLLGFVEQVCHVCKKELAADDVRWRCHHNCNHDMCELFYLAKTAVPWCCGHWSLLADPSDSPELLPGLCSSLRNSQGVAT